MYNKFAFLKSYEDKLNFLYVKANTKSKKKRIMYDLFNFSEICHEYFDINKTFNWENDEELISMLVDSEAIFIDNTLQNKIIYDNISNSVINTFKNINYPFYVYHGKLLNSLTFAEVQELVFEFLNKYDEGLAKMFEDKLDNDEVFTGILYDGSNGFICPFEILNKNWIFLSSELDYSVYYAATIAHEFGHCFEDDIVKKTGVLCHSVKSAISQYQEVSSKFFEYAFLNFLNENKIYSDDADILIKRYHVELLEYMHAINLIHRMNNIEVNDNGNIKIVSEEAVRYANNLKEQLNYHNLPSELNSKIKYKNSFIYGLGNLISIYLYENYKEEPNIFKKEFKNAMINYSKLGIGAFERLGITEEKLINGDTLKRVLVNSR